MPIEHIPFVPKKLEEERDKNSIVISLKLNEDDQKLLNASKLKLHQEKDGTAIKQLMYLGAKVLHDEKTGYVIDVIFDNDRKNKRLGITEFG